MNDNKRFSIIRVVSRDLFRDAYANIQNLFGARLTPYEKMVKAGIEQCEQELTEKQIEPIWHRFQITELHTGAIVIFMYGERK